MRKLESTSGSLDMGTESECSDFESESEMNELDEVMKQTSSQSSLREEFHKPAHSYIALIAMAILSSPKRKMVLSDIYKYVMEKYPFYKSQDKSWRNSVRHNLSLNECFIKVGRSENGKGNFWAVHPANLEDFLKGDYRRRRARRRNRKVGYSPGFSPIHSTGSFSQVKLVDEHSRGFYYHPYPVVPPKLTLCYAKPYQSPAAPIVSQAPKKSFRIDSILGKDKDEKKPIPDDSIISRNSCPCCPPRLQAIPTLMPSTTTHLTQYRPSTIFVGPKAPKPFQGLPSESSSIIRHCYQCSYLPPRSMCSISCLHDH